MSRRRPLALLAVATITLAACGSESTSTPTAEPAAEPAIESTTAPTGEPADEPTTAPTVEPAIESATAPTAESAEEPVTEPAEEPADEADEEPVDEPAAEPAEEPDAEPAPEPTEAPAPEPVGVVDGCSTDGSPTLVENAAGPAPAVDIRPESADSPLIDLAVRRINCAGGWANLRNEVPSDRAILIWFWAPH